MNFDKSKIASKIALNHIPRENIFQIHHDESVANTSLM